jgi:hypothetical protein
MPRVGFVCPDGVSVTFADCLASCRMGQRCLTKSTLSALSKPRPWTGTPSTTQLLNGTRMEYLKVTHDYYVAPPRMAFALLGSRVHLGLADADTDVSLLEERFEEDDITGIADCYELENGEGVLTDYKTWGSWRVARALGVVEKKMPDPSGAVYQSSGRGYRKGEPKMVMFFGQDPTQADLGDALWQVNRYRLFFEDRGFPVARMQLEVIVRDGGTWVARSRGVNEPIYVIPVRRLEDKTVRGYFDIKARALTEALDIKWTPAPCTTRERWDGRRCREYCEVAQFCDVGQEEMQRGRE